MYKFEILCTTTCISHLPGHHPLHRVLFTTLNNLWLWLLLLLLLLLMLLLTHMLVHPTMQILILFTAFYLLLAILSNWLRHSSITSHLSCVKKMIIAQRNPSSYGSEGGDNSSYSSGSGDNRKPDGNVSKKDPEMDEKLFPGYTEGVASQHRVPTADGREVDETGQLVASNEKHAEESEGNVSEAGELRAIIRAMYTYLQLSESRVLKLDHQ